MRTLLLFALLSGPVYGQQLQVTFRALSLDEAADAYKADAANLERARWHPSDPNVTVRFMRTPVGDNSMRRWEAMNPGFRKGEAPGSIKTRLEFERYYRAVKALEAFDRRTK